MLNEKDRKYLERSTGKHAKILQVTLVITCGLLIVVTAIHLVLAKEWGRLEGVSFSRIVQTWSAGTQPDHKYSGTFVTAMDQIGMALLEAGMALLVALKAIVNAAAIRRAMRIIEVLKQHDAWQPIA